MMQYFPTNVFVHMPIIFFLYGISFFMLGIIIVIDLFAGFPSTKKSNNHFSPLIFLGLFGVLHGLFEFSGMYTILQTGFNPLWFRLFRLALLTSSFYFLLYFGISKKQKASGAVIDLASESDRKQADLFSIANLAMVLWCALVAVNLLREKFAFSSDWFVSSEIFARYILGVPGALMSAVTAIGLGREYRYGPAKFASTASAGFALYAIGVFITPKAEFFPASSVNYETFYSFTHLPTQVFRTFCAFLITWSLLKFFRKSEIFSNIRSKAILHVLIAVVIPTACILLLISYLIGDALLRLSYRENEKFASITANRIFSFLDNTEETVKYHILLARSASPATAEGIFYSLLKGNGNILRLGFFDMKGEILRLTRAPAPEWVVIEEKAEGARLKKLLGNFSVNTLPNNFYLRAHDENNVMMVIPLNAGRMEVSMDVDNIYDIISQFGIEKGWHVLLLDDKYGVVLPKEKSAFGSREISEHSSHGSGLYGKAVVENGIVYNAVEAKVEPTGWSVLVEIPRNEIVSPIFSVLKALLFGVLIVNLFAVLVAVGFVSKVTKPIDLIARRVKSIGEGEASRALEVRTGDELQTLSEEVEKMALQITEKKKMERQIAQTEKIASLGRLVAGVAHELNNPLAVILGYSQVLLKEIGPDRKYESELKMVEKHALKCQKIVEDLLNFSRTKRHSDIAVDINANVQDAISLMAVQFSKSKIAIAFEPDPERPQISGDPDRLHQLFLNLALNAMDAMAGTGGTLTIRIRTIRNYSGKSVGIVFKDTGCGIPPENIGRIFDPFFTTKDVGKGTGLGLSVSYGIVQDHGGKIHAESEIDKGTRFLIIFPCLEQS